MNSMPDEIKTTVSNILSRYPVSRASVFGSFARDEATGSSDLDLLVEFYHPVGVRFFGLKEDLEKAIDRRVDLFRYSDMMLSAQYDEVLKEAQTIYVRPPDQRS